MKFDTIVKYNYRLHSMVDRQSVNGSVTHWTFAESHKAYAQVLVVIE